MTTFDCRTALGSLAVLAAVVCLGHPTAAEAPPPVPEAVSTGGALAKSGDDSSAASGGDEETTGEESEEKGAERDVFTLEELLSRARRNDALVREFEAKRKQAEWKEFRANWARAPKIKADTLLAPVPANAEQSQFQQNVDEIGALNIGPLIKQDVELVVPLYTFGQIGTLKKLADVGVDVAELKRREAVLNVLFQTKRAFYGLQMTRRFEKLLDKGNERIEKKLDEMETDRQFGEADFDIEDFRKLEIFDAEVDDRIANNEKRQAVAQSGLKKLASLQVDQVRIPPFEDSDEPAELHSLRTYERAARRHRPDLKKLDRALRARKLQVDLERQKFYPKAFFAFSVGYSWSTEETAKQEICRPQPDGSCLNSSDFPKGDPARNLVARPDSTPLNGLSVRLGVGLRWKLDFAQQLGKLRERQAQRRALKAQRRRALDAVEIEIEKKYREAKALRKKMMNRKRAMTSARRWRDQLGFSLESAGGKIGDALKPLKAYYKAKAEYFKARYDYLVARAKLARAVGVDVLSDVQPAEADSAAVSGGGD